MVSVGYGDIRGTSIGEKIICFILEIVGIIVFSMFTGSLTSIIASYDASQGKLKEKMATLNKIQKKYDLDVDLYDELRQSIKYDFKKTKDDQKKLV